MASTVGLLGPSRLLAEPALRLGGRRGQGGKDLLRQVSSILKAYPTYGGEICRVQSEFAGFRGMQNGFEE